MTNANDAANPCIESINHSGTIQITTSESGLSKMEFFAAMAMQGIMGRAGNWDAVKSFDFVGKQAVLAAESLIEQLNKTK